MKETEETTKKKQKRKDQKREKMFRDVLKHLANQKMSNEFYFTGRPIYRLGRSFSWYNEFEVEKIEPVQAQVKRRPGHGFTN